MKRKTCSRCFTQHSQSAWAALPLLGDEEGDEGWRIEFRVCECGFALSMTIRGRPSAREERFYAEASP